MNVAILLLNQGRGSGEVARQHVKHLIRLGHRVYFLYPDIGEGIAGAVNIDVALHTKIKPVHEYLPQAGDDQKQVARMSHDEMAAYLPAYEKALANIVNHVDIMIGHHANLSAVAVHRIALQHNKPYVIFVHGTGIEPRHKGLWDDKNWAEIKKAVRGANGILVTTEYVRDEIIKPLIPLPDYRFLVLPCGVDLDALHPGNTLGIREKYNLPERYVICPGALTQSKGPQNVVEASREYAHLAETVFIGDGELREQLQHRLNRRGKFLGYVSDDDKAKLINAAELLTAAPEKKEHFGIIYAEALAAGTPPVAYQGGGVDSIITTEVGILTERSPVQLGKRIASLLENPDKIKQMSEAGRKRAEALYDYNKLVAELSGWLEKFI